MIHKEEGIPKMINHSTNGKDCYDEGKVQTYRIPTQKLVDHAYLYISVWAVNQVYIHKPWILYIAKQNQEATYIELFLVKMLIFYQR